MSSSNTRTRFAARTLCLLLAAASPLAVLAQELGKGGSKVTGGAGPSGSTNASTELEKCEAPKGTIAVVEPRPETMSGLTRYGLGSPTSVVRLLIQQSNCFQVVERGAGMQNMQQERALAQSGELQSGSNIGKGQMAVADFLVTPNVVFTDNNAGGVGGGLLSGFGTAGRVLGGIAGGIKFKQAQTSMLVVDARSGIQVAAAEGSAEQTDFSLGTAIFGSGGAGGMGAYTSTAEGKVVAASFIDNWNNIVRNIRNNPSILAARAGPAAQANAAQSVQANAANAGDVMRPKIAGVKVLKNPADGSAELQTLGRADEVLFLGEEKNGFVKVTAAHGDGWVKKILLVK